MIQSGIVIILTFFILKELYSMKIGKDDFSKSTDELRKEFQKRDFLLLFLFFILIPVFTVVLTSLYNWLSNWSIADDHTIIFIIKPNIGTWIVIAMMSSLGYAVFAIVKTAKLIFKADESNYWVYYNRKYGFKATRLLKYLGITLISFSSIMVILSLNTFVKFKESKIEINQFESLKSTEYDLEAITKIIFYQKTIAPNGNVVDKPHYAVLFNDGFKWRTTDGLRTPGSNDSEIFTFLSEKTGKEIEVIEIE